MNRAGELERTKPSVEYCYIQYLALSTKGLTSSRHYFKGLLR